MTTTPIDLLVRLIICGLLLYIVTWVVRHSHGPGDVFLRLRKAAGIVYLPVLNGEGKVVDIEEDYTPHDRSISKLFGCFVCLSVWFSIPVSLFVNYDLSARWVIILAIAATGLAVVIYKKVG